MSFLFLLRDRAGKPVTFRREVRLASKRWNMFAEITIPRNRKKSRISEKRKLVKCGCCAGKNDKKTGPGMSPDPQSKQIEFGVRRQFIT
jgi:hypothetical protein